MTDRALLDAPLSFGQARIWLLNQITGPDPQYNVPVVIRFDESVDVGALGAAIRDVVARHEILRTSYEDVGGRATLAVHDPAALPDLLTIEESPEQDLAARIREVALHRFDLAVDLPTRSWLLSTGAERHVLLVVVHHIAVDEASLAPLLVDLGEAYRSRRTGSAPQWQEPAVQYRDFAARQRAFLGDSRDPDSLAAAQLEHWVSRLSELPEEISLPTDRARSHTTDTEAATVVVPVADDVRHGLLALARDERVAPFTLVKAAVAAFLTEQGAGEDIPLAGFVTERFDGDLDDVVGFLVNTLVFRADTSGTPTFRELVRRLRLVDLDAYSHQDVPFDEVVRAINPPRSTRHPLTQVAISLLTADRYELPGTDASVEFGQILRAKFDLHVNVRDLPALADRPAGMDVEWIYSPTLFDEGTVERLARELGDLLGRVVNDPDLIVARRDAVSHA